MIRRPFIGALVAASSLVLPLAAPAGASPNKDWKVVKFPCRTGHKAATLGYSPTHPVWVGYDPETGEGIADPHGWASWLSNPCKGQWLAFWTWSGDPSEASYTSWSLGTETSGRYSGVTSARLLDAAICSADTSDANVITNPRRTDPVNCAE